MRIVALDCATTVAGVAVSDGEKLVAETYLNTVKTHSERLVPMIDQILDLAGLGWPEIDALAVTIGPGSFTGLRIGLATAKGIAQGLDKPLVAVNTLDALAANVPLPGIRLCPILDARKNEVYTSLYREGERLWDYLAIPPGELLDRLAGEGAGPVWFIGDGVQTYRDKIVETLGEDARFLPDFLTYPRAAQVARSAYRKLLAGEREDLHQLIPFYIRQSEAENTWEKKHGRSVPYATDLSTYGSGRSE